MRATRQSPLEQWALLIQHEAAIIEHINKGLTLSQILPQYGITMAYWHKYKSPAQQAAVQATLHNKQLRASTSISKAAMHGGSQEMQRVSITNVSLSLSKASTVKHQ